MPCNFLLEESFGQGQPMFLYHLEMGQIEVADGQADLPLDGNLPVFFFHLWQGNIEGGVGLGLQPQVPLR